MDTKERRSAILQLLRNRTAPVTGAELAARMGVSRQVIVQDIALLRTGGPPAAVSVVEPMANSSMFVWPSSTRPAARRRSTAAAS